jgi:hypothetical protein
MLLFPAPRPEPKAIDNFMAHGHPWMAYTLAMSWVWGGVIISICCVAIPALWALHHFG